MLNPKFLDGIVKKSKVWLVEPCLLFFKIEKSNPTETNSSKRYVFFFIVCFMVTEIKRTKQWWRFFFRSAPVGCPFFGATFIASRGHQALAMALQYNQTLVHLRLDLNKIRVAGAKVPPAQLPGRNQRRGKRS